MFFLRENITVMETSIDPKKGGFLLAIGTEKGNLYIRSNWEEPRCLKLGRTRIMDMNFSQDSTRLLVSTIKSKNDFSIFLLK